MPAKGKKFGELKLAWLVRFRRLGFADPVKIYTTRRGLANARARGRNEFAWWPHEIFELDFENKKITQVAGPC